MYNELYKLYRKLQDKHDKKLCELLLEQYQYGCFDTSFKTECYNFIQKYKET